MKRTFNYTGRQRIERRHVRVRLIEATPEGTVIDVNVNLTDYDFPLTTLVFLETRGESAFKRHLLENPFDPLYHEQLSLEEIGTSEKTNFYLRVVQATSTGQLLGLAENIPLVNPADVINSQDALLRVEFGDIGQEIWRTEPDPHNGPVLKISRDLRENRSQFANDPMFLGCVVPQVFRRVLEYALKEEDDPDVHDTDFWFHEWHRWMMVQPSLRPLASRIEDEIQSGDISSWIDETVEEFAKMRTNRFVSAVAATLNAQR
jgi:hypothetical protein